MTIPKSLKKPLVCVALTFVVATAVSLSITAVRGVPAPTVHDEFAYLLGADTFASGRVTNPTHPLWEHFESFHIIHQPSYTLKYPPAQSMTLAGGQWLGHPIIGSCLATGLAAAALVWMLAGWLPRKYLWLVMLFGIFHPGLQIVWGQSYWGGNLALTGAALLIGSFGRLTSKMEIRYAATAAFGTILLANSRPFEGAVLTMAIGVALIWKLICQPEWKTWPFVSRVLFPGFTVLGIGVGCMLAYNATVSGSAFKMPYRIHESTYGWNPIFLWQSAGAKPDYRHPVMKRFFETDKAISEARFQSASDVLKIKSTTAYSMGKFFCGGTVILALLGIPWLIKRPRYRVVAALLIPSFLAALATPWAWPHYCAPAAPLLILLFMACLVELWRKSRNVPIFRMALLLILPLFHGIWWVSVYSAYGDVHRNSWANHRVAIYESLLDRPGEDLVLVRYSEDHNPNAEWVYNRGDIDQSQVVWAREMSDDRREQLIQYFHDRNVWVVEADAQPPTLRRFRSLDATENQIGMNSK